MVNNSIFYLVFVSCYSFLTTPELKQNNIEKIEDINPSNCFLPLTWEKNIFFKKKQLKILLTSCQHNESQLNIYLIYLLTIVDISFLARDNL